MSKVVVVGQGYVGLPVAVRAADSIGPHLDTAVVRALSPSLSPEAVALLPPPEDLRDVFTRWIDTLILVGAGLPGYLERRLDSAFDAVIAEQGAPPA